MCTINTLIAIRAPTLASRSNRVRSRRGFCSAKLSRLSHEKRTKGRAKAIFYEAFRNLCTHAHKVERKRVSFFFFLFLFHRLLFCRVLCLLRLDIGWAFNGIIKITSFIVFERRKYRDFVKADKTREFWRMGAAKIYLRVNVCLAKLYPSLACDTVCWLRWEKERERWERIAHTFRERCALELWEPQIFTRRYCLMKTMAWRNHEKSER